MPKDTSNTITILPDFIANQIAAGEVVQRPESVVKELVENAVDAGATAIAVVVRGSGKQLIHIVDNGDGMSEEDLRLSVKRHATSKILTTEDLEEIRSFGFRGEALASISSVSNLEIRTKRDGDAHAWSLVADPMKDDIVTPCNSDKGTQIFVKNLFYNVPARRKFLKSDLTEFRYISNTMIRFALSHPQIRFTFYDNDSLIFDVKPSDIETRIEGVLGKKTAENIIPVKSDHESMSVSGFVGMPLLAKSTGSGQYLFLNDRAIISKSLNHAVFSAYEHLLERKAHPFFILNIEVDPKVIDINVHPQKQEVKFENERTVYNLVKSAIGFALQDHNLVPELHLTNDLANTPIETESAIGGSADSDLFLVNKITGEIMNRQTPASGLQGGGQSFG
ncbi:MAG: DNA mismatch repair endonuclease MutL, partial [Chlorobi bacterium]|nr:DNA mismatch repair endonuclease MutL [Chlorobiota bacterium]